MCDLAGGIVSFNPAQFHRSTMTKTGVVQSICVKCGRVVGFSSAPSMLELADRAHVCKPIRCSSSDRHMLRARRAGHIKGE